MFNVMFLLFADNLDLLKISHQLEALLRHSQNILLKYIL